MTARILAVLRLPGRLMRALLLGLLWGYRNLLSPMLGPRCRYLPSCSAYAVEAITVHGAAKGSALAAARVCRCHPWAAGGLDPVPPRGRWRREPDPEPRPDNLGDGPAVAASRAGSELAP